MTRIYVIILKFNLKMSFSLCVVCDDGGTPQDVDDDDANGYTTSDNDKEDGNGPSPGTDDDDVPVFDEDGTEIEPPSDGTTSYNVTIKTPPDTDDLLMEVDTPIVDNVLEIVIEVNGEEVDRVSSQL